MCLSKSAPHHSRTFGILSWVGSGWFLTWIKIGDTKNLVFHGFHYPTGAYTCIADHRISMDIKGFWWIWRILEISWNLLVRSRRACPSRIDRDSFFPRKRSFQRRLKTFEIKYLCFSTLSGRSGVVEIPRCRHNQQIVENQGFWWILEIFNNLLIVTTSGDLDDTGPTR